MYTTLIIVFHITVLRVSTSDEEIILRNLGEKHYLSIKEKSLPRHGTCWFRALQEVKNNCDKLNDHEHSILALKLANCFLEDSGHDSYDCHEKHKDNEYRKECIGKMSDRAFGVYNEFYTHTTHICFYLNYEIWHTETKNIINELYLVSSKMKEQLLEASQVQEMMLESQKKGLVVQNEVLNQGKELGTVIQSSSEIVNSMVMDFKESAKDQKELLYEIFSYMRSFQNWIVGEVSWFQSIMYYVVSCILSALFSSAKRTMDSRITLFVILSSNVVVERMLVQYYETASSFSSDSKIALINATWYLRKCALIACLLILFYTYYFYKDDQAKSYKILQRIENQLNMIEPIKNDRPTNTIRCSERLALKRLNVCLYKSENLDCTKECKNSKTWKVEAKNQ